MYRNLFVSTANNNTDSTQTPSIDVQAPAPASTPNSATSSNDAPQPQPQPQAQPAVTPKDSAPSTSSSPSNSSFFSASASSSASATAPSVTVTAPTLAQSVLQQSPSTARASPVTVLSTSSNTPQNTSASSLSSNSPTSSPNTSTQSLSVVAAPGTAGTSTASNILSLSASQAAIQNTYHAEEVQFALENKKTLKRLLKISKHWNESMKSYCQQCHLFSDEMLKQSEQMITFAQPKEKSLGGNLAHFGNALRSVNGVHDQMLNEIQDVFSTPVANFVDYDFAEVVESHKRVTKSKEDYDTSLGKISASIKKSKTGIDETKLINYETELEKLKEVLESQNKELGIKLNDLSYKNETKYLRAVLHFINAQYLFFTRGAKLLGDLKPKIEDIERYLEEIQPPKVVEGHLMKKSKQVMGGWNKCWYVLKDGMLYCYKGKKEFHPENALNILLCSVRVPQQILVTVPTQATNTLSTSSKEQTGTVDYRFEILHPRKKLPIVLQAESEEERDRWVTAIQEAISNSLNSQTLDKRTGNMSSSGVTQLGKSNANLPTPSQTPDEINQQVVRIIQKAAGNNVCADCTSADPDWASINMGVLICKGCSGVHRSLGTHISKVRSLTLDKWSPESIYFMREVGNSKFNVIYEHSLSDQVKPTEKCDRAVKEAYIKAKYQTRDFMIKSTLSVEELSKVLYEMTSTSNVGTPVDISRYLKVLGQGADVNYADQSGRTNLHQLIWRTDDVTVLELLLQRGANITMVDSRGWTPMHYAAFFNRPRCASLLIKRGFDAAIRAKSIDHLGRSALDLAKLNKSKEAEQVLKGEVHDFGLTVDAIEAGTVVPYETSLPNSTDFPREEILSEDEDDKYTVENEAESSWSESERDSVGRASFSSPDGPTASSINNTDSSTNTNNNNNVPSSFTISTSSTSNSLTASRDGSSTHAKPPLAGGSPSLTSTSPSAQDDSLQLPPHLQDKLNRPKSAKRRPSIIGKGRNTLRLVRSKLSLSTKMDAPDLEATKIEEEAEDDLTEDNIGEDTPLTSAPATPPIISTTDTNNSNSGATTPIVEAQPVSAALPRSASVDNINQKQQPDTIQQVKSSNDLTSGGHDDGHSTQHQQQQQKLSPAPFKAIFSKFKGMTNKKHKDEASPTASPSSPSANAEQLVDIPDNVSISSESSTSAKSNDHSFFGTKSDFLRKKKKKPTPATSGPSSPTDQSPAASPMTTSATTTTAPLPPPTSSPSLVSVAPTSSVVTTPVPPATAAPSTAAAATDDTCSTSSTTSIATST
ncbi:hypothetical protein SAMD00019534_040180 [Acytostelium subglobosum LB1]|uniref:hypothetical protein n=1 Tax=Acytostelium subglobosum LB1 TaxID=1410327 RepID=UPI000644D9C8|nr:hypothetical protein SAMD00019534_040180 [Acytostelium subglobosum LB1]GAM20843.1 hypothetical protein SAMD00019534_040180 [Acytostelium subglobosum LB1]|eukprot:XP_012755977.1 hypothetical protein SAMD00019534_040180 [Acytostelium subglobosum LB1]